MKKITGLLVILFYYNFVAAQSAAFEAASNDTTKIFTKTEIAPVFKSGGNDWSEYLRSNINVRIGAENGASIGTYEVIVSFVIRTNGMVKEVVANTRFGFGMEQEAIRVIRNSPDWRPARQNGYDVNFYYRQPVTFVVEENGIHILSKKPLTPAGQNIVQVSIDKVDVENIELEMANGNGSVQPNGAGKFIVSPTQPGAVIVDIYIRKNGKRKKISSAYFTAG